MPEYATTLDFRLSFTKNVDEELQMKGEHDENENVDMHKLIPHNCDDGVLTDDHDEEMMNATPQDDDI